MSLLQEERQEGEREREEQQGLSSGNADRLTGLLRPAETNNQRREESGEGRDNRDTLAKVSAFIWPSPPASSRGAARASSPSAASNGGSGAGMARRRGGGNGVGVIKRCFMGSCGLAPVQFGSETMS